MIPNSDRWLREISIPLAAEEIHALLNGVVAGASFNPGLGGSGTSDPQAKMDGRKDEPRDKSGKWTADSPQHKAVKDVVRRNRSSHQGMASDLLPRLTPGYSDEHLINAAKKIKSGKEDSLTPTEAKAWHSRVFDLLDKQGAINYGQWAKKANADQAKRKDPHGGAPPVMPASQGLRTPNGRRGGGGIYGNAADEIMALLAAGPHDVSSEKRQHGKFAPGGASQGSPATAKTGSPLDPATGQAEPPKQSAIHKERYDAHTTAAKTYQDLVKQHLNLAKIALDPQDRQRHIDAARGHKQAADQHLQQAETHAQAHSKAVTTEANMAGQAPGGMMAPNASAPKPMDPLNQTQQMAPVKAAGAVKNTNTLKPAAMPKANAAGAAGVGGPSPKPRPGMPGSDEPVKPYHQQIYEARTQQLNKSRATPSPAQPAQKAQKSVSQMSPEEKKAHYTKQASRYVKGSPAWQQAMSLAEFHGPQGGPK